MSIDPSALYLIVKTHLHPIGCFPFGSSITSHISFVCSAIISSSIAAAHLGSFKASLTQVGAWIASTLFTQA